MLTREDIVKEARSFIGTPFCHRGRLKGGGVDCIGLVFLVAKAFGLVTDADDDKTYPADPPADLLLARLKSRLYEVDLQFAQMGDVACFDVFGTTRHCGFITPHGLVHVFGTVGKVVEHGLAGTSWERRMTAAFKFPGVM